MSESNIERVIGEILSDEKNLIEFFSCENQDELYKYYSSKGSGYTREEFDEFIEETIEKAGKEINQNSLSDGGGGGNIFWQKDETSFHKSFSCGLGGIFGSAGSTKFHAAASWGIRDSRGKRGANKKSSRY